MRLGSLFVVPKVLIDENGTPAEPNDAHCVSLEHKLGIHASPTAILSFGDKGGAVGYLVGEENRGLEYMFVMMNLARWAVGIQGLGISDRAYQRVRALLTRASAPRAARSAPPAQEDARPSFIIPTCGGC